MCEEKFVDENDFLDDMWSLAGDILQDVRLCEKSILELTVSNILL